METPSFPELVRARSEVGEDVHLVREHDADIILDQTLLRSPQEYQLANAKSEMLMGCDFALLNPLFTSTALSAC
ncbi:hypothetical protein ACPSKX_00255 [Moritella viscosa]